MKTEHSRIQKDWFLVKSNYFKKFNVIETVDSILDNAKTK
jgi:hypothetical protein